MLTRLSRFGHALPRLLSNPPARFVSQSKPTDAAGSVAVTQQHPRAVSHEDDDVSSYVKYPDFHGFSMDPVVDVWNMRLAFFFGISVAIVLGGAFLHYLPDPSMRSWARLEAERLILQREKEGLPLISENYYDPSKIVLSTDGEE